VLEVLPYRILVKTVKDTRVRGAGVEVTRNRSLLETQVKISKNYRTAIELGNSPDNRFSILEDSII
jgi:hypothetical protein